MEDGRLKYNTIILPWCANEIMNYDLRLAWVGNYWYWLRYTWLSFIRYDAGAVIHVNAEDSYPILIFQVWRWLCLTCWCRESRKWICPSSRPKEEEEEQLTTRAASDTKTTTTTTITTTTTTTVRPMWWRHWGIKHEDYYNYENYDYGKAYLMKALRHQTQRSLQLRQLRLR